MKRAILIIAGLVSVLAVLAMYHGNENIATVLTGGLLVLLTKLTEKIQ